MEVVAIFNPGSGNQGSVAIRAKLDEYMAQNAIDYKLVEIDDFKKIKEEVTLAIEGGAKLIIAVGGDGTVNQIINILAYTDVCLGIVPTGTGNLLATALGIPIDTIKALDIIFQGQRKKMDLGRINDHYFSTIAGCGFDAKLMTNVASANKKKLFGYLAYVIEGVIQAFLSRKSVFWLTIDGKEVRKRAISVLFINSANILGNLVTLVPNSSFYDGLLDVCIYSPSHTGEYIHVLWNILTKHDYSEEKKNKKMEHFKASKIRLECRPKTPIQADGDFFGYPPADIDSCPKALTVCAPLKVDTFVMNPEEFFKSILENAFKSN